METLNFNDIAAYVYDTSDNNVLLDLLKQVTRQIRKNGASESDKIIIYQETSPEVAYFYNNSKGNETIAGEIVRDHYSKSNSRHGVDQKPTPGFEVKSAKLGSALRLSSPVGTFDKIQTKMDTTETLNIEPIVEKLDPSKMYSQAEMLNIIRSCELRDENKRLFVFDTPFRAEKLFNLLLTHHCIKQHEDGMFIANHGANWLTRLQWTPTLTKKIEESPCTSFSIFGPDRKPVFVGHIKSTDLFAIPKFLARYKKHKETTEINNTTKPQAGSPYDAVTLTVSDIIDLPSFKLERLDCNAMNLYGTAKDDRTRIQDELYLKIQGMAQVDRGIKQHLNTYYNNQPPKRTGKGKQKNKL